MLDAVTNEPCGAGYFCPIDAAAQKCQYTSYCPKCTRAPVPCPAGNYCPSPSSIVQCTIGDYCPQGSYAAAKCPVGHACPTPDAKYPCVPGMYGNEPGRTTCYRCPANTYTDEERSLVCRTCMHGLNAEQTACSGRTCCGEQMFDLGMLVFVVLAIGAVVRTCTATQGAWTTWKGSDTAGDEVWEWKGSSGEWHAHPDMMSLVLEHAYSHNLPSIPMKLEGVQYTAFFDHERPFQRNDATGSSNEIRRRARKMPKAPPPEPEPPAVESSAVRKNPLAEIPTEPTLARGFVAKTTADGKSYWFNPETGEDVETFPTPLLASWAVAKDDSGMVYYWNESTNDTSWERPQEPMPS